MDSVAIVYSSSNGTSRGFAEELKEHFEDQFGKKVDVLTCNALYAVHGQKCLETYKRLVLLLSTTGAGQSPQDGVLFREFIGTFTGDLSEIDGYLLLGFGDSNYEQFCGNARFVHQRLAALNARSLLPISLYDDSKGDTKVLDDFKAAASSIVFGPINSALVHNTKKLDLPRLQPSFVSKALDTLSPLSKKHIDSHDYHPQHLLSLPVYSSELLLDTPEKRVFELVLDDTTRSMDISPGDTLMITPYNKEEYVCLFMAHFKFDDPIQTYLRFFFQTDASTTPRTAFLHGFYNDPNTSLSLKDVFKYHLDLRAPLKKSFLRSAAEFASTDSERQALLFLASKQGDKDLSKLLYPCDDIHLNLFKFVKLFPSTMLPIEFLLERLEPIKPRHYSVASYTPPFSSPRTDAPKNSLIRLIITDFTLPLFCHPYYKTGLSTGYLNTLLAPYWDSSEANFSNFRPRANINPIHNKNNDLSLPGCFASVFSGLSLASSSLLNLQVTSSSPSPSQDHTMPLPPAKYVAVKHKRSTHFTLPTDHSRPLILIASGSGISPFIAFLEKLNYEVEFQLRPKPQIWVLYGCQNEHQANQLFHRYLLRCPYLKPNLYFAYSRQQDAASFRCKYVQDLLTQIDSVLIQSITNENAAVFVSGNRRTMLPGLTAAFLSGLMAYHQIQEPAAKDLFAKLKKDGQYFTDVWI